MQTKKWLTYTFGVLFTLIALAVVGLAGFRIGMMQSSSFARIHRVAGQPFRFNFGNGRQMPQGNIPKNDDGQPNGNNNFNGSPFNMQRNPLGNSFVHRGFDNRHIGFHIFPSFFGLIEVAILALAILGAYKLIQSSGWRLVRTGATEPVESEVINPEVKGKKNKSR